MRISNIKYFGTVCCLLLIGAISSLFLYRFVNDPPPNMLRNIKDLGFVSSIDWNTSRGELAIASKSVTIFAPSTGKIISQFGGGDRIALNPSRKLLAITNDLGLKIYDSVTGMFITVLDDNSIQYRTLTSVKWSPDSKMLVATSTGGPPRSDIKIWDAVNFNSVATLDPNDIYDVPNLQFQEGFADAVWSPDSRLLAIAPDWNGPIVIIDSITWSRKKLLDKREYSVTDLDWSENGDLLVCSYTDGNVLLFRLSDGEVVRSLSTKMLIKAVSFRPKANQIVIAGDKGVKLWDYELEDVTDLWYGSSNDATWGDSDHLALAYNDGVFILKL